MLDLLVRLSIGGVLLLSASLYIIFNLIQWTGPLPSRFTHLWYLYKIYKGDFKSTNIELHEKYGPVVRIVPNEYSINDVGAAKVIYGHGNSFVKVRCPGSAFGTANLAQLSGAMVWGMDASRSSPRFPVRRPQSPSPRNAKAKVCFRILNELSRRLRTHGRPL